MKSGKPFAFGQLPYSIFFSLLGNLVSAKATFHQVALPTIKNVRTKRSSPLRINALASKKINKRAGRMDFRRGIAKTKDGVLSTPSITSSLGSTVINEYSKLLYCFTARASRLQSGRNG